MQAKLAATVRWRADMPKEERDKVTHALRMLATRAEGLADRMEHGGAA
jgi:hypothetical protein